MRGDCHKNSIRHQNFILLPENKSLCKMPKSIFCDDDRIFRWLQKNDEKFVHFAGVFFARFLT